jgi:hypothetical protein
VDHKGVLRFCASLALIRTEALKQDNINTEIHQSTATISAPTGA